MVNYALNFFGIEKVKYTLLHCYNEPEPGSSLLVNIKDILSHESERGLESEIKRIQSRFDLDENNITLKSKYGNFNKVVSQLCRNHNYDLIIMGNKGKTSTRKKVFGSHTSEMIRKSKVPLLIIPEYSNFKLPLNYGYATDLIELNNYEGLEFLNSLFEIHLSILKIVNVSPAEEEKLEKAYKEEKRLQEYFNSVGHEFVEEKNKSVTTGIRSFIIHEDIDLLVLIARNRSFLENIFHKSVTLDLSQKPSIPLLILKDFDLDS